MLGKLGLFALLLNVGLSEAKLPSFIKPCARAEPNFNQCAKKSAITALPSLAKGEKKSRLPPLDPLMIPVLTIEPGPNLKVNFTNLRLHGLEKSDIKDVNFNFKENKVTVKLDIKELRMESDYEIAGSILVLPINGKGPSRMDWGDVSIEYTMDFEHYDKEGADYIRPKKGHINYHIDKMTVNFENLFNGDKALGETTNQFINENWREAEKDLGPGIAEAVAQVITSILKGCMELTPFNEIFPEHFKRLQR